MSENRMEIMWGVPLMDAGFTSIPNLLIRNYRKLGIEHGEWGLICQILTYKHDTRDPYPSREDLANLMCCSWRQIEKWVASLKSKGFLRTGRRRNQHSKQWDNRVFNFKPMLDAVLVLVGEQALPPAAEHFEIIWDDEVEPREPEVHVGSVPEVHVGLVPEVHTKKKSKKENIKDDDDRQRISDSVFQLYIDQITEAQFAKVCERVKSIQTSDFESYLIVSVEKEIANLQTAATRQSERKQRNTTGSGNRISSTGKPSGKPQLPIAEGKSRYLTTEEREQLRVKARLLDSRK